MNPNAMFNSYMETALWAEMDNSDETGGDPLNQNYTVDDIHRATRSEMWLDCLRFIGLAYGLLDGLDPMDVGHDFWLTRNGHGAGFWDGDYEEQVGQKLTELCKQFKEVSLYVDDNDKIRAA